MKPEDEIPDGVARLFANATAWLKMTRSLDSDEFLLLKDACRAVLVPAVNNILEKSRTLTIKEEEQTRQALLCVLADLTAEVASGILAPSREQFLKFMGRSFDHEFRKRDGDTGEETKEHRD